MIRLIPAAVTAATLLGSAILPARWVPDPQTNGMTETYVPDGYNCDMGRPWNRCVSRAQHLTEVEERYSNPSSDRNKAKAHHPGPAQEELTEAHDRLQNALRKLDIVINTKKYHDIGFVAAELDLARNDIQHVIDVNKQSGGE